VPVITTDVPEIKEIAGTVVLYAESNEQSLFNNMQRIYKDEELRNKIIESASAFIATRTKSDMAEECWYYIREVIQY
jgi:glycosyltransferase involved in cell wall biosynthesis